MKVQFEFDEKDIYENKRRFDDIDKKAESLGLKKLSFGNYEGIISDNDFSSFFLFLLIDDFFDVKCKKFYVWFDKNNLYKEDILKTIQEVKEINKKFNKKEI